MRTFPGMRALGAGMAVCLSLALTGCSGGSTASKPAATGKESNGAKSSETKPNDAKPGETGAAVKLETVTPDALQKKIESLQAEKKAVLVDFWATWCVPCREAFPHTVELAKKYEKDGLAVISVAMEEDPKADQKKAVDFLQTQNATITHYISAQGAEEAMEAFGVEGGAIPHYRVYGRDGKFAQRFVSGDPDKTFHSTDIEAAIRKALELPE